MTSGYFNYSNLENLIKDRGKQNNKNNKNNNNEIPKIKLKPMNEKKPLDNDKIDKEPKNNINGKKENGIINDTPNPNKIDTKPKIVKDKNYNQIVNQLLSQKETKLLTNSQYVSFENQIGDNSCYINVIMHFLYIFPCVNDFLIKKYQEQSKEKEKQKEKEKEKKKEKEKEEEKQKEKENGKEMIKETKKDEFEKPKEEPRDKPTSRDIITKKPEDASVTYSISKEKRKENELNDFLFNLGKILNSYQDFLSRNNSKKNITNIDTRDLRESLSICSDNQFKLNCISDPVEFLIYILELINKENSEEIHLYFHLKLIEEERCSNFCPFKANKKYDKDNFIYQIYVEEIFNYIKNQKISFDDFKENLFMLSYYSLQNEVSACEKCNSLKNKILICNNEDGTPKFLLVNCVWKNAKPNLKEVIEFLYFISLVEKLDNLFICPSKTEDTNYYLIGIIFYSFTFCHYINLIFNLQKNVFTLYNDTGIIEFENIYEVFKYITIEQLKKNNKAYFYPVLLVYGKENIYEEKAFPLLKRTNKINYELLIDECSTLTKVANKPKEKPLTEEEKEKNYKELILAQINYENMEKKYQRENDDIFSFLRSKEKDFSSEMRKINIVNNEQKKIKSNNFLQQNKFSNKKVNKSVSVDKKYFGTTRGITNNGIGNTNTLYNPYNIGSGNHNNLQRGSGYLHNYGYSHY